MHFETNAIKNTLESYFYLYVQSNVHKHFINTLLYANIKSCFYFFNILCFMGVQSDTEFFFFFFFFFFLQWHLVFKL